MEMKIEITVKYHYKPVRMAKIKKQNKTDHPMYWQGGGEAGPLICHQWKRKTFTTIWKMS